MKQYRITLALAFDIDATSKEAANERAETDGAEWIAEALRSGSMVYTTASVDKIV